MMNKKLLFNETYLISKNDNPKNIVIFSHSLSQNYESDFSQHIIKSLYENDIAIVVFNYSFFKNHANLSVNLINEVSQLGSVVSLVKKIFKPKKINLIGISLGATINILFCSKSNHKEISSIFVISFPFKLGFPPNIKLLQDNNPIFSDYFLEYRQIFKLVNKKIFVIQGDQDDLGSIKECLNFFKGYNNCTVFKVKGANHSFISHIRSNLNYFNDCSKIILSKLILQEE